ncbi:MAG: hypothetical protein M1541_19470 [Acidobacteria bacterium]|nr:hypothetical protein [Acidobacteriota bacterium]
MSQLDFDCFFRAATGYEPFDYQRRLAESNRTAASLLVKVPTGLGKTAALILPWLWNRSIRPSQIGERRSPQRLIYCLPMRTLIEQAYAWIGEWLTRLAYAADANEPRVRAAVERLQPKALARLSNDANKLRLLGQPLSAAREMLLWLMEHSPVILMGGEENDLKKAAWDIYPEEPAILVGTQDMLLSRTLNRGYAMSRYRWPMQFGLLNSDCLWVMDEIQLMGPGLGTACQLDAFRVSCRASETEADAAIRSVDATWYASATASRELLVSCDWRTATGDTRPPTEDFVIRLGPADFDDPRVARRLRAAKRLEVHQEWHFEDGATPGRIVSVHKAMLAAVGGRNDLPRRTLVICNTVRKARLLFTAVEAEFAGDPNRPQMILLHARFRRHDRQIIFDRLNNSCAKDGQIVISTQVIEAGVDISSAVLWMEAAPLPSMVQRLGRLNRAGEFGHGEALVTNWCPTAFLVGVGAAPPPQGRERAEDKEKRERENAKRYLPYEAAESESSLSTLSDVPDASPASLETALVRPMADILKPPVGAIRQHELLDLFDTDANLSLGYNDVSPFVRGLDSETDVQVLWRAWGTGDPLFGGDVGSGELCPVPLWEVKQLPTWRFGFVWQGRERGWQSVTERNLFPGAVLLLPISAGGYSAEQGWTGRREDSAISDLYQPPALPSDADLLSILDGQWESIERHTQRVRSELQDILTSLGISCDTAIAAALLEGIDWHDFGKNHPDWQRAVLTAAEAAGVTPEWDHHPFAKFSLGGSPALAGKSGRELRAEIYRLKRLFRPGLRHEVASALALRQHHRSGERAPSVMDLLAEYLVMSHRGHVRKVLRDELPRAPRPCEVARDEVCGIVDGTSIDPVCVRDKMLTAGPLSIECRQLGRCRDGSEGWAKCVVRLLESFGPLRLAYLEALFRAADWRASLLIRAEVGRR